MTTISRKPRVVGIGDTLREGSTSLLALEAALRAAEEAGATTDLLDLCDLDLPPYEPGKPLERVRRERKGISGGQARRGRAVVEHGRLSRNARGRHQKRSRLRAVSGADERPYLQDRVVGLMSTTGGGMAAVNAIGAMVNVVHALRGVAAPLPVPVTQSWKAFDEEGNIRD